MYFDSNARADRFESHRPPTAAIRRWYWSLVTSIFVASLIALYVPIAEWRVAPCYLQPSRLQYIHAPEDATIIRVLASEGSSVSAGQPIAELASSSLRRDLLAAERLHSEKLIKHAGQGQLQTSDELESAAASLRSLRSREKALVVRAEEAGFVLSLRVTPGQHVQQDVLLATVSLEGAEPLVVGLMPADDASAIKPGQLHEVRFGSGVDEVVHARVRTRSGAPLGPSAAMQRLDPGLSDVVRHVGVTVAIDSAVEAPTDRTILGESSATLTCRYSIDASTIKARVLRWIDAAP